jgi:endonuclease III
LEKIEIKPVDLELTLYPSFTLSLFDRSNETYVKVAGMKKGCRMRVDGRFLLTECEEALYWSGAWFMDILDSEETGLPWLVDLLRAQYPNLGLSVDPQDPLHIMIPIFLSQSTNYHGNVIKWSRKIWEMTDDPFEAAEIAPRVAGSYQLRRLRESFPCIASAMSEDIWTTRRGILRCKYCGPKVADAFLLFGMADTTSVPVDRHFISMVRKLDLWDFELPKRSMCVKYECRDCPANECVRRLASRSLGRLAGWAQTVFYLHEKLYCSKKLCRECLLRSECVMRLD